MRVRVKVSEGESRVSWGEMEGELNLKRRGLGERARGLGADFTLLFLPRRS